MSYIKKISFCRYVVILCWIQFFSNYSLIGLFCFKNIYEISEHEWDLMLHFFVSFTALII